MIKFTTENGTQYLIYEVDGEEFITRVSERPLMWEMTMTPSPEMEGERVSYDRPPTVNFPFIYSTPQHGLCVSSRVVFMWTEK